MLPTHITLVVVLVSCLLSHATHAQSVSTTATENPGRTFALEADDLILLNVAAKGRVVELLANELARTEIIRALLVEYARECVENVTALEKQCLNCMIDRCGNRMSECHITGLPLKEIINHNPSPINGVQFLSNSPRGVQEGMKNFSKRARTDILRDIPETLREEGEAIMHSEVDQSLQDLDENMNTKRALQKLSLHVQKAADNVHRLPNVGDKLGSIIVENEDHAINLAELLARRLKSSRPFLDSINHNGARVLEQMPSVIDQVEERVQVFKQKVSGVFNKVLNTFHKVMNDPETPVVNGGSGQWQAGVVLGFNQKGASQANNIPGQNGIHFPQRGSSSMNGIQSPGGQFQASFPQQQQFPNPTFQGQLAQSRSQFPQGPAGQGQGQWPVNSNHIAQQQQLLQNQLNNGQQQFPSNAHNMNPAMFNIPGVAKQRQSNQIPGSQPPGGQGLLLQSRRRRHTDADCKRLEDDPDKYCRTYETLCHNCTLEKRLRFEVCGEGVEKARDEIKRIDESVESYLKAYEDYVAGSSLVLKIEVNTNNRLHKTNSFYDALITAKIGPSIFRYTTKMILNINDIRSTGLQIGDEIWEKLWENEVFVEARKPEIVPKTENIMGQVHIQDVHKAHAHSQPAGSASTTVVSSTYFIMAVSASFLLIL